MPKLSVVVITKNEETKIKDCLDTVKAFADEIIIVDDHSTDQTAKICRGYGAKVITNSLNRDFARQRNIGTDEAAGDWVMQMDADEIIPKTTAEAICRAIEDPGEYVAFDLRRTNFLFGKPLRFGGSCTWETRLFKKGKGYYEEKVHEQLSIRGAIGKIDEPIDHYPFSSIAEMLSKSNFYNGIEAQEFVEARTNISSNEIRYRLTWKSLKLFWKLYIRKRGYKDGVIGFVWCAVNVMGPQIKWLKIWEAAIKEGRLT